ncbi:hypothetical protein SAMN04487905_102121 [Actinopolyspora xinjiangensis]|uniref:Uncharacterized protein n=1 Tax=Actinopolyspora xinjiangensis TaxID=405564 RepID=A0A1H0Q7R5_9ACTN|nr:hypothetical protein SAMN04487905_102121 [Actinopolyspora xinjiangensis]
MSGCDVGTIPNSSGGVVGMGRIIFHVFGGSGLVLFDIVAVLLRGAVFRGFRQGVFLAATRAGEASRPRGLVRFFLSEGNPDGPGFVRLLVVLFHPAGQGLCPDWWNTLLREVARFPAGTNFSTRSSSDGRVMTVRERWNRAVRGQRRRAPDGSRLSRLSLVSDFPRQGCARPCRFRDRMCRTGAGGTRFPWRAPRPPCSAVRALRRRPLVKRSRQRAHLRRCNFGSPSLTTKVASVRAGAPRSVT